MSRWFRFYDDAINDPKILRLSDAMFRAWMTLLCIASKHDGILPPPADIALMLRMKITKVAEWLAVLTAAGLVDNKDGVFSPHNWNARQYKSDVADPTAASRQKAYRERNKNRDGDRNATVTVTDTRTETEQITEQKEHCPDAKAPRTRQVYSEEFETKFWQPYPRSPTMSKSEAWKSWMKLTPEQRTASCQAIEPYRQFLRSKPNLETVHACRFLSQQRFEGFLGNAAVQPSFDVRSHIV